MQLGNPSSRRPLRLWPGVAGAVLLVVGRYLVPLVVPGSGGTAILGGMLGGLVILAWWLFFSRAPWLERIGVLALIGVVIAATSFVAHPSIANGMMGLMFPIFAIPLASLALVVWAVAVRGRAGRGYATLAALLVLGCGALTLIRTSGMTGDADSQLHWRWTPSAEERLLASAADPPAAEMPAAAAPAPAPAEMPAPAPAAPVAPAPPVEEPASEPTPSAPAERAVPTRAEWPGFRGPERDGVIRGARIETDWSRSAPVQLWRRPVGPGWSSFAVHGDVVYTQEQRGEDEIVSAHDLKTGAPLWRHRDAARFWESNGGAGPRGTPTLGHGRVYTLGATGILNALDARDGSVVWSRQATADTGSTVPDWGISGSPLIVGDSVVVATAGVLAAYDAATGAPRWVGPKRGWGYSSPQLATIGGVEQIVLVNGPGAMGVSPADGTVLWSYEWSGDSIVQPAVLADGDVLIGSGSGMGKNGILRVSVAREGSGWAVKERWTSNGLKPYFNDFVVHEGHAYGFDGSILSCIDLADGARKWKGGRYGHGQMVLLPEQDLLLVLSEDGELALVAATSERHIELARIPAIEGKTWNHPVLVGDVLLVRNGEEMAAFRLARAGS